MAPSSSHSPEPERPAAEPRLLDVVADEPPGRWRQLLVLAACLIMAMAPWFSAAAVAPSLREEWSTDALGLAVLGIAVQLGFAAGALLLAVVGAPDVVPAPRLMAAGALAAAAANVGFAMLPGESLAALPFRVLTGAALAAVYPVTLKVVSGWFRRERGFAVGVLIGALTLGSALPYLARAIGFGATTDWRAVVLAMSVLAAAAAVLALLGVRRGPFEVQAPRFSVAIAASAFRQPSVRLANLGYLGHMWELYAMWTWIPVFLVGALAVSGVADARIASLAAFLVVAAGAVGSVVAGVIADRVGRTATTMGAMGISGACALVAGQLFGAPVAVLLAVTVLWGLTVIADSAQFSAAVSELAPPGTAGSALAVQTASGFLLTGVTILGVGLLEPTDGDAWRAAWSLLALGPLVGILAMAALRRRPDATRMASGRR